MTNEEDIYHLMKPEHFEPLMSKVLNGLKNGESICLYGMPGIGRRYFVRQLEILLKQQNLADIVITWEATLYEKGLVEQIENEMREKIAPLRSAKQNFVRGKANIFPELKEYLETHKIIIILSYIERLKDKEKVFKFLRILRTLHQTNLSILTTCDQSILVDPDIYLSGPEQFAESFYAFEPFDLKGTKRAIDLLLKTYGLKVKSSSLPKIHELSGGNASLSKYICKAVDTYGDKVLSDLKELVNYPPLKIRLDEFIQITFKEKPEILKQLKIVNSKGKIFAKALQYYLKNYEAEHLDILFPDLTQLEKRILSYLLLNKGTIINKDRLAFWMGMSDDDFSLWAIYKIISRIKKKIEGKFKLENVKGRGYRLIIN